jgi:hypothetical protein
MVLMAALAPLIVLAVGFVAVALVDLKRAESVRYLPKWGWALFIICSIPTGAIIYMIAGRPDR